METTNRMANHLKRVTAAMRLPSCEDEHQGVVLEEQLDAFWGQDVLNHRYPQEHRELSLERQFQSGDFLSLPTFNRVPQNKKAPARHEPGCVVRGEEINDIPTSYVITGLKSSELPVIGTYVDRRVIPGFRYRVRLNQSDKYIFDARPLYLESVGMGYGKRLVFEGSSRNNNENYFWSDSQSNGYGFKPIALWEGDRVVLTQEVPGGSEISRDVDVIACVSQTEMSTNVNTKGDVEKRFQVKFLCRSAEGSRDEDRASLVVAVAFLKKAKGQRRSKVDKVLLVTQCSVRASAFVRNSL